MVFAHDTEVALQSAAALINTVGETDTLGTTEELTDFVRVWNWSGSVRGTSMELKKVRELRGRLRHLWTADTDTLVEGVNKLLTSADTRPQLVRHDDWDWHLHATDPEQPLAERMAIEAALALVDVIRAGEVERLRKCAADDCDDVLIDLSRNRSRRFCSQQCGNRMAAAAYRERKSSDG
ncbi:MAG: RNA-binding protein [Acidimicrobiia bacterium]|nr:RNA-binding protein [Acidimicrobiia bacterium]